LTISAYLIKRYLSGNSSVRKDVARGIFNHSGNDGLLALSRATGTSMQDIQLGLTKKMRKQFKKAIPKPEEDKYCLRGINQTTIYHRSHGRIRQNDLVTHIKDFK